MKARCGSNEIDDIYPTGYAWDESHFCRRREAPKAQMTNVPHMGRGSGTFGNSGQSHAQTGNGGIWCGS